MKEVSVFWFRRDLRLEDNAGLMESIEEWVSSGAYFYFRRKYFKSIRR